VQPDPGHGAQVHIGVQAHHGQELVGPGAGLRLDGVPQQRNGSPAIKATAAETRGVSASTAPGGQERSGRRRSGAGPGWVRTHGEKGPGNIIRWKIYIIRCAIRTSDAGLKLSAGTEHVPQHLGPGRLRVSGPSGRLHPLVQGQ
jgi:hypothetical protein